MLGKFHKLPNIPPKVLWPVFILVILGLGVGGFFVVNYSIFNETQGEDDSNSFPVITREGDWNIFKEGATIVKYKTDATVLSSTSLKGEAVSKFFSSYTNGASEFSALIPVGWDVQVNTPGEAFRIFPSKESGYEVMLVRPIFNACPLLHSPSPMDEAFIKDIISRVDGFGVLSWVQDDFVVVPLQTEHTTGYEIVYSSADGSKLYNWCLYTGLEGASQYLQFTSGSPLNNEFEAILASVNPTSLVSNTNDINVEASETNNWDMYENEAYGYRLEDITDNTVMVTDVYEGGNAGNPSFRVMGGGHFAIAVHDNTSQLTVKEFFEQNDEIGTSYEYEKIVINGIEASRVYNKTYTECAIEWVGIPYGDIILTSRFEDCEINRRGAVFEFMKVMDTLRFTENEYDIVGLEAGDTVGGMTVEEIEWSLADEQIRDAFFVEFSGQATLSGEYRYYDAESAFLNGEVCFYVDNYSVNQLPRSTVESTIPWFCFKNKEFAQERFGPIGSTGEAIIVIDDYYDVEVGAEIWAKATLVESISKE